MSAVTGVSLNTFIAESPIQRGAILEFVAAFAASLPAGSQVLDAGAGAAPYREMFGHCAYRTQDWPGSLHTGLRQADIVGDLHDGLPVEAGSFDAVLCTEVLEHVVDPRRVLRELRRILREGGRLAVTVPFVAALHEEPHDHGRPTSHGLRMWLDDAAFDEVRVEPLTGWFSMLAHVLREQGQSTQTSGRATLSQRAIGFGCLLASKLIGRVASSLDRRFDHRHAMPLGWTVLAVAGPR